METYQSYLRGGLARYFDITDDYQIGNYSFDFYANFNQHNARYLLSKQLEIYAYDAYEHIFHKHLDRVFDASDMKWLNDFFKEHALGVVSQTSNHMSSTVTLIITCEMPSKKLQKTIEKFKFYKSFAWGLKGWVNGKVILVDTQKNQGITNRYGKKDLHRFLRH